MSNTLFIFIEAHRKVIAIDSRHYPIGTSADELFRLNQGVKGKWHEDCHESIKGFKVYKGIDSQIVAAYYDPNSIVIDWIENNLEFIGYICPLIDNEKKSWLKNITTHNLFKKFIFLPSEDGLMSATSLI